MSHWEEVFSWWLNPYKGSVMADRDTAEVSRVSMKLTEKQEAERKAFERAKSKVRVAQQRLGELANKHKHVVAPTREPNPNDIWDSPGAKCMVCGNHLGWWCPKSKDHLCHYEKTNSDSCDFCGHPDERK